MKPTPALLRSVRLPVAGALLAAAVSLALPAPAEAHRAWLLPSATVLSGSDPWITVDAAISNDLFYFEHFPMQLDGLVVTAPDGKTVEAENAAKGRYRSTFDVHLTQPGTYRIAVAAHGVFASYKVGGERKRMRGTAEDLKTKIPANAEEVRISESWRRMETYVTAGTPTKTVLEPTGKGLEIVPVTHPNDLFSGETGKFRLLMDGKPAGHVKVEVIRGGIRYRDQLGDKTVETAGDGSFQVTWAEPGMYWISADFQDDKASIAGAQRRAMCAVTLEVLPK